MPVPFLLQLAVGVVLNIIGFLLMARPKQPKPPAVRDLEDPTAESGRPIPVVFGSMTVTGLNILYYGDKSIRSREISSGGKK